MKICISGAVGQTCDKSYYVIYESAANSWYILPQNYWKSKGAVASTLVGMCVITFSSQPDSLVLGGSRRNGKDPQCSARCTHTSVSGLWTLNSPVYSSWCRLSERLISFSPKPNSLTMEAPRTSFIIALALRQELSTHTHTCIYRHFLLLTSRPITQKPKRMTK